MNPVRLWTLTKKECHRFLKVWLQTIMSPIIIAVLYFAVFGAALSSRIVEFSGIPYLAFIVPGSGAVAIYSECLSKSFQLHHHF
jgi:ABC-2 type transport system permease protein